MENNIKVIRCSCGCRAIELHKDEELNEINIIFWTMEGNESLGWKLWQRIKDAYNILKNGRMFFADVIVSADTAKELSKAFAELTNKE